MLSKFKTLPVLAAMAGGLLAAGALAPSPARADCDTVSLSDLYVVGAEFFCGDKKYYEFSSADFDIPGTAAFSQSPDGTVHTLAFTGFTPPGLAGPATYTINFKVDVTPPNTIIDSTSGTIPSGMMSISDSLTLTSSPNPYEFTGILEITDPGTTVTAWNLTITQTPGPLPILGAGAAFGVSRKLRRRIKSAA
ncbi:MAG: hypothetical protein ACK40D_06205 [Cyanobacteriota bacterium]|jgi:hypothetical protein